MSVGVIQNIVVETVSEMSTKVDLALYLDIERLVETVSGMSTKVDLTYKNKHVHVETVSKMSTKVDISCH